MNGDRRIEQAIQRAMHSPAPPQQQVVLQLPIEWEDGTPVAQGEQTLKLTLPLGGPVPAVGDILRLPQVGGDLEVVGRRFDSVRRGGAVVLQVRRVGLQEDDGNLLRFG